MEDRREDELSGRESWHNAFQIGYGLAPPD